MASGQETRRQKIGLVILLILAVLLFIALFDVFRKPAPKHTIQNNPVIQQRERILEKIKEKAGK